jgi:molecular chaperone DnaK
LTAEDLPSTRVPLCAAVDSDPRSRTLARTMSLAIGIDLGTTRCAVGVFEGGRAATLLSGRHPFSLPSVVGVDEDGAPVLGERARRLTLTRPQAMWPGLRRLLGRRFDEQGLAAWRPFTPVRAAGGDVHVRVGEGATSPPELLAPLLRQARRTTETQLGEAVHAAVVAVRGQLGDAGRRATIAACRIAGIDVRRLVHSTTAAALVHQATRAAVGDELVAVVDFGGGGFDAALIEVGDRSVEVLAHRGVDVGGEDLDARVGEWLLAEAAERAGVDGAADPVVRARVRDVAERVRVALSDAKDAEVHLPYLAADEAGPRHLHTRLTQARLEKLTADLLERCKGAMLRALDESGRSAADVGHVLLVGGCARMPAVHGLAEAVFKQVPSAAPGGDDVVARGAALLGGLLATRSPERSVHEALSRPLWLQVGGAEPTPLFPRRAAVPAEHSEPVTTPGDGRPGPVCRVLEGDRTGGEPPTLLAFTVSGRPEVEVKFTLDHNHTLDLSVREVLRGKEARLAIEGRAGLEEHVLTNMVEEARAREAEARLADEVLARRQRLDAMIQRVERALGENDRLSPEVREATTAAMQAARAALQSGDDEQVTAATEAFAAALRPLPGELGAAAAPPAPPKRLQPLPAAAPVRAANEEVPPVGEDDEDEG